MNGELFATLKNHQFIMTCQWKKERSPLLFSAQKSPEVLSGAFFACYLGIHCPFRGWTFFFMRYIAMQDHSHDDDKDAEPR